VMEGYVMKKSIKKFLSFAVLGLIMTQTTTLSALATTPNVDSSTKNIEVIQTENIENENLYVTIDDEITTDKGKQEMPPIYYIESGEKNFFICENNYSSFKICAGNEELKGDIYFDERAKDFSIICTKYLVDGTTKEVFNERYFMAGKPDEDGNDRGAIQVKFGCHIKDDAKYYKVKIKNHDGDPISGKVEFIYAE
jgi:hypothetical protein